MKTANKYFQNLPGPLIHKILHFCDPRSYTKAVETSPFHQCTDCDQYIDKKDEFLYELRRNGEEGFKRYAKDSSVTEEFYILREDDQYMFKVQIKDSIQVLSYDFSMHQVYGKQVFDIIFKEVDNFKGYWSQGGYYILIEIDYGKYIFVSCYGDKTIEIDGIIKKPIWINFDDRFVMYDTIDGEENCVFKF